MAGNYQEYVTRVLLNDEQAESKIDNLRKNIKRYKKEKEEALAKGGKEGDKAWKEADRNIRSAEAEMRKLSTTAQSVNRTLSNLSTASAKELKQTIRAINKELESGSIERGTDEWKALNAQLKRAKTELAGIQAESAAVEHKGFFSSMADNMNKYWGLITQFIAGIAMLTLSIRRSTQGYADMEEVMADVRKYTGQTTEEVHAMNEEFKAIDTRTTRDQLNRLAGAAGRLGITSHDGIMEFVDAADKIDVALGEDLGKDAVAQIGKLAMAFGEDDRMGLRGAMLATGSAINELSQNSSASATYLVDFTARVAGIGKVAGMTQAQIMGWASTLDENMQRDEMAATAFSNLIGKLANDSSKFAKTAGIDVKEFADLVSKDMNGALIKLFKTLQTKGGLMQLAPIFEEMGLDGSRAVGVLTVLANKVNDVQRYQKIANDAYQEGISIIKEFNVQNTTVQAEIDKNIKRFNDLSIELGEKLLPVVKYTVTGGSLLVKTLSVLVDFSIKYRTTIVALTVATIALYAAKIKLNAAKIKKIALDKLEVFWNKAVVASCKKLWALLIANPYTAIAAAVGIFAAAIYDLTRKSDDLVRKETALSKANKKAGEEFDELASGVEAADKILHNSNATLSARKEALETLLKVVPDYNAQLTKEGELINDNNEAIKAYLKNLEREIKLKAAKEELQEAYRQKRIKEKEIKKNEQSLKEAEDKAGGAVYGGDAGVEASRIAYSAVTSADNKLKKSKNELINIEKDIDELVNEINLGTQETTIQTAEIVKTDTQRFVSEKKLKKEQLEEKRRKMQADKNERAELNKHLAGLAALYAKGDITYSEFLDRQRDMQLESLEKRKAIWGEESNETMNMADDKMNILNRYADKKLKQRDAQIERERASIEAKLSAMFYDRNSKIYMNEDALNEALFQNDMDALNKMMAARNAGSEQWMQLKARKEQQEQEHQISSEITYQQRLQHLREQFGEGSAEQEKQIAINGLEFIHQKQLKEQKELLEKGLISKKQYDAKELAIEEEHQKMLLNIKAYYADGGPGSKTGKFDNRSQSALSVAKQRAGDAANPENDSLFGSLFGNDLENYRNVNEQLKQMENEGVITHAEANAAKARNDAEYLDTLVSRTQMMYSMINGVVSAAADYAKACSDLEVAKIEKNYDKQIKAAGNNTKKKERLEKKKDEEIRKARTKANNKAMKIQIAQAIATSAMSALDAYGSAIKALPFPINMTMAPIAAGMALAAGALQIATIKKQNAAQQAGYYEGGFTPGKNYHRSAGIVHEGEFIANHHAVENPQILPALQLIDAAQRNNTVGSLTAADITRSMGGASVVAPIVNVTTDNAELRETMTDMHTTVDNLRKMLEDGVEAFVIMDGDRGLYRQTKRYEKLLKNK